MRSGQTRRASTRRTQPTRSRRPRTAPRSAAKKLPPTPSSALVTSSWLTRCSSPRTTTSLTGTSGERSSSCSAIVASSSPASANSTLALRWRSLGLSHICALEYSNAEVLITNAVGPSSDGHQAVAGHAGRGVHFEQPGIAFRVQHQVDASPAAATQHLESLEAQRRQLRFLRRGQAAGADVLRVVGEVLVLVVVVALRRLDADERQRSVVQDAGGVLRALDEFLCHHDAVVVDGERVGFL